MTRYFATLEPLELQLPFAYAFGQESDYIQFSTFSRLANPLAKREKAMAS